MVFKLVLLITCYGAANFSFAQSIIYNDNAALPRVVKLNWLNEQFLIKQRQRVEVITRRHFGQPLKLGKRNIPILQRIIDEHIIPTEDKLELQAMGVILGDIFVASHRNLSWQVYEDELGKSHAVCVDKTPHCLFPVTMISRRIEVGGTADVNRLFNKGMNAIKGYLPRLPYAD